MSGLFQREFFGVGVAFGIGCVAIAVIAQRAGRREESDDPVRIGAVIIVVVTVLALAAEDLVPARLPLALGALLAAGVLAQLTRLPTLTGAVLALPGAWMIATETSVVDVAWIRIAVVVVAVLGGACLASFEGNRRARSIGLLLLPLTAAGMYFTVPDTERAAVFFGVAAPFLCVGWLLRSGPSLGAAGSWALAALVAWITATGGSGRESSIVGGIACLGLFAVEPLSRLVARSRMGVLDVAPKDWRRVWAPAPAFTAHLALVYIASRVAGLRHEVASAVAIVAVEAAVGVIVGGRLIVRRRISESRGSY